MFQEYVTFDVSTVPDRIRFAVSSAVLFAVTLFAPVIVTCVIVPSVDDVLSVSEEESDEHPPVYYTNSHD